MKVGISLASFISADFVGLFDFYSKTFDLKEVEDLNKEIAILKNSSVREIAIIKKLKSENHELKTNNSYILQQFKDQTKDLEFKNKELIYKNKELEQLKSFHINEIKFMELKLTHALEK